MFIGRVRMKSDVLFRIGLVVLVLLIFIIPANAFDFAGNWTMGGANGLQAFGDCMVFSQSGIQVTGGYPYEHGRLVGTVTGLTGNMFVGKWSEEPTYTGPKDSGTIVITMTSDGKSIDGTYDSAGGQFSFHGGRSSTVCNAMIPPTPTPTPEPYQFVTKWGIQGSGDGQLINPTNVAVDSSGNVYVVDMQNNRIQKFSSTGTFLTKWGTYGPSDGQFNRPYDVAVDSSGNVYVADTQNNRIQKFSSTGTFLTKWGTYGLGDGQFSSPTGVGVDSSGNIYVTDTYNHRIQKFTPNGIFLTKWGNSGSGDGQFSSPDGVAVDLSGNVYVTDWGNHRIQKFSSIMTTITPTPTIYISAPPTSYTTPTPTPTIYISAPPTSYTTQTTTTKGPTGSATTMPTTKIPTPWPTNTSTRPTPLGVEIGIIAIIGAALLVLKRK
jgi:hypothetical protein